MILSARRRRGGHCGATRRWGCHCGRCRGARKHELRVPTTGAVRRGYVFCNLWRDNPVIGGVGRHPDALVWIDEDPDNITLRRLSRACRNGFTAFVGGVAVENRRDEELCWNPIAWVEHELLPGTGLLKQRVERCLGGLVVSFKLSNEVFRSPGGFRGKRGFTSFVCLGGLPVDVVVADNELGVRKPLRPQRRRSDCDLVAATAGGEDVDLGSACWCRRLGGARAHEEAEHEEEGKNDS